MIALAMTVAITIFVVGVSAFSFAAWYVMRRGGWLLLAVFWIATACTLAYVQLRRYCSQALTCDVGGVDYFARMWPRFAWMFGVVLGGAAIVVGLRAKRERPLSWREPLGGLLGAVAGSSLVYVLLLVLQTQR